MLLRPRGTLIGRQAELQRVLELIADPSVRLVSLLGPGGMGKTRLALAVAEALVALGDPEHPQAVVVPLSAVTEDGELLAAIGQAVGAEPEWAGQPVFEVLTRSLADRELTLVLDNLEQLIDSSGTLEDMMALLDQLPRLTIVCTSRVALRLGREQRVVLGPLSLPDPGHSLDEVRASDAVRLFQDRASAAGPGFEVTAGNAAAVAEICRLLDGQPLALELAAARVRILPPEEMVRRTGHLLALLTGGGRDLPERQRSMRAALEWSAQLLDEVEAGVFAQLSVFAGGWTVAAAEAVCESAEDVLEVLARLVDKSLVAADQTGRLSMLETVREFAGERLTELGEATVRRTRDRHAVVYADLAATLGPRFRTSPNPATRAPLDAEVSNFAAALEWSAETGQDAVLGRMVFGLLDYWFFTSRIAQGERWLTVATQADLPPDLRVRLSLSAGRRPWMAGDVARAAEAFSASVEAARELDDRPLLTRCLTMSSLAARHSGHLEEALALIDEALAEARAGLSDPATAEQLEGLTFVLGNERGEILEGLGRTEEARAHFEAYRQQSLATGDHSNLAWALGNLAMNEVLARHGPTALEYAAAAMRAADEGGSEPVQADARFVAGLVELHHGDPVRAVSLLADSVRHTHAAGQLLTLPDGVSLLGAALLRAADAPAAARMLAAGQAWRKERGLPVVGRLAESTIARAHNDLASMPVSELVTRESARGTAVPFGWIDALDLPEAVDLRATEEAPVLRLVDMRADGLDAAARASRGSAD